MYLEGSDQHRGWFMSSLMTSVGAYDMAPYKAVVSQGFTLDGQGRKMSKSLGNVIDPNKVCAERGADVLRLWVASVDTSNDVPCDDAILAQVGDAYRRFRNTIRFLLGELEGQFNPATDAVPVAKLTAYDRLVLARMCEVHDVVTEAYEGYRFNNVFRVLYDYIIELSNGYLNATKDRMYCDAADSESRRCAQTVWAEILSMLVHDLQPILVYTTDEAMEFLPESLREGQKFAALLDWYQASLTRLEYEKLLPAYQVLSDARAAYTKAYETALEAGEITEKTTQATRAEVVLPAEAFQCVNDADVDFAEVFVCSAVTVSEGTELAVSVFLADGERCDRCWNWRNLGEDHLCHRCHEAVAQSTIE